LKPLWAVERLDVQKQEVERYLWTHRFQVPPNDLTVVTPHFSVVNYRLGGSRVRDRAARAMPAHGRPRQFP
jgi:hypothetical protein